MTWYCGIYGIYGPDDKVYVGKSFDIEERFQAHRLKLRKGEHSSPKFQFAWNTYGEKSFLWKIIELCLFRYLTEKELYYFGVYKEQLYNERQTSYVAYGSDRTSLSKPVVLSDGTCYASIAEFADALGYADYSAAAYHLRKGLSPDEIVAQRKKDLQTSSKEVYLSDGQYFPTMTAFAEACGYTACASLRHHLDRKKSFDWIARKRGLLK